MPAAASRSRKPLRHRAEIFADDDRPDAGGIPARVSRSKIVERIREVGAIGRRRRRRGTSQSRASPMAWSMRSAAGVTQRARSVARKGAKPPASSARGEKRRQAPILPAWVEQIRRRADLQADRAYPSGRLHAWLPRGIHADGEIGDQADPHAGFARAVCCAVASERSASHCRNVWKQHLAPSRRGEHRDRGARRVARDPPASAASRRDRRSAIARMQRLERRMLRQQRRRHRHGTAQNLPRAQPARRDRLARNLRTAPEAAQAWRRRLRQSISVIVSHLAVPSPRPAAPPWRHVPAPNTRLGVGVQRIENSRLDGE